MCDAASFDLGAYDRAQLPEAGPRVDAFQLLNPIMREMLPIIDEDESGARAQIMKDAFDALLHELQTESQASKGAPKGQVVSSAQNVNKKRKSHGAA
jgi:hypothetical protein